MRVGKTLYHCHGAKKGTPIHKYESVDKAQAAHRAIMASKTQKLKELGKKINAGRNKTT